MTRRPRGPRPAAAGRRAPARRKPPNSYAPPPHHDPLADSRLRPLVERYASLARARLDEVGPNLYELRLPATERDFFGGREQVLLAFAVGALEQSPDAEMAVVGSPFVEQLLAAIRARGTRLTLGLIASDNRSGARSDTSEAPLPVPVRNATIGKPAVRVARHPVGRLLARVLVRAGAAVEEHLVESGYFDLSTGAPLPPDVAGSCLEWERVAPLPADAESDAEAAGTLAGARPLGELVELMIAELQARLAPRVDQLRAEAARALASELARIDAYYKAMLEDAGATESDGVAMADAGRAIQAEHARRRLEEERRHQVHALVHPLQMVEAELRVQRAEWPLSTDKRRRATLAASRFLSGPAARWILACPTCAREPSALVLCRDDRIACESCARECSLCGAGFRVSEVGATCHVDEAPVCPDHARTCSACDRQHCTAHAADCADGEHSACAACIAACERCGREFCATHRTASAAEAPKGSRRLCTQCVAYCEGRRSEPVGVDEAAQCGTCDRFVCEKHQARCDVDGNVHCSAHLVRTDQSRRLVCEADRSACVHEPDVVFAADEVGACPVCGRAACPAHMHECLNCGRRVCDGERDPTTSRCATCARLAAYPNPSPAELAAAADAADGRAPGPRKWRAARDATHLVVEMTHGWRRRAVFAVRHGESRAETVMSHSRNGSKRTR